jgi:hypothetical protein
MLFDTLTKGDDGLRFVKVLNDNKRKVLIQMNGVKISDISDEVVLDLVSDSNIEKVSAIDAKNVEAAQENSTAWFGKELSEGVIRGAYTPSVVDSQLSCDKIEVTKVFDSQQQAVDFETLQKDQVCDVILEFSGLWFAKKTFACTWNLVQVRLHPEPVLDTYPDQYAFVDDDEQ